LPILSNELIKFFKFLEHSTFFITFLLSFTMFGHVSHQSTHKFTYPKALVTVFKEFKTK